MTATAVYLGRAGQQLGPYTPERLAQMATAGEILASDLAWHEGMAGWESASTVLQALGIALTPGAAPAAPLEPVAAAGNLQFFTASTLKLVVMSVCTLGLYELYWFYRNWVLIKSRTGSDLMPFWRAFFAPIWSYSCFQHIEASADEHGTRGLPPPALLAVAYFVLQAMWRLPDPYWLISTLSFVPLVFANSAAIEINRKAGYGDENARFTGWNWAGLIAGGLVLVLALVGTFLPDPK